MTGKTHCRGFTLLEIMVSLAIVGLLVSGYLYSVSQSIDAVAQAEDKTFAHWIALNRLTEIRLQEAPPEVGDTDGEIEYDNRFWRWQARISETGIENLFRVDISISHQQSPDDLITTLTGFLGPPIIAGAGNPPWASEPERNVR